MLGMILIFCGLGAVVRYFLSKLNKNFSLPLGTLLANILGAFLIGYFYKHFSDKGLYVILSTGFCGGLSTLSTFNSELLELFQDKKKFFSYLVLTYSLGFSLLILGFLL
ncbi:MAG: fluoride efflux transporter CrcB [Streptococcus sp.]|nr:fluoride efflux transporter CrcB [Streptococcus sp.]